MKFAGMSIRDYKERIRKLVEKRIAEARAVLADHDWEAQ